MRGDIARNACHAKVLKFNFSDYNYLSPFYSNYELFFKQPINNMIKIIIVYFFSLTNNALIFKT